MTTDTLDDALPLVTIVMRGYIVGTLFGTGRKRLAVLWLAMLLVDWWRVFFQEPASKRQRVQAQAYE